MLTNIKQKKHYHFTLHIDHNLKYGLYTTKMFFREFFLFLYLGHKEIVS